MPRNIQSDLGIQRNGKVCPELGNSGSPLQDSPKDRVGRRPRQKRDSEGVETGCDASKRGKNNRRKGAQFERDLINYLRPVVDKIWRGYQNSYLRKDEPDVCFDMPGVGESFTVECKTGKAPNITKAMKQINGLVSWESSIKLVASKKTGTPMDETLITMELRSFHKLLCLMK